MPNTLPIAIPTPAPPSMPLAYAVARSGLRRNNFNLIRVCAASGVILSHAYPLGLGADMPEPLEGLLKGDNLGRLCVFIFFVTSGYFIAQSFDRRASLWDYILARVLRIYPALFVMLCVMLPIVGIVQGLGSAFWTHIPLMIAENMTMFVQLLPHNVRDYTLFPGNPMPHAFNGSLWTLKFEVLCYIGVIIAGYLGVLRHRGRAIVALALSVLGYYIIPSLTGHTLAVLLSYVGVPFAFGAAAYVWRATLPMDGRIAVALGISAALLHPTPLFFPAMIATVAYTVLWFGTRHTPGLHGYNRVGDYSYGIYIYAFPIQQMVVHAGLRDPWTQIPVALCMTLFFAILSWHYIETPILRLRKKSINTLIKHNNYNT